MPPERSPFQTGSHWPLAASWLPEALQSGVLSLPWQQRVNPEAFTVSPRTCSPPHTSLSPVGLRAPHLPSVGPLPSFLCPSTRQTQTPASPCAAWGRGGRTWTRPSCFSAQCDRLPLPAQMESACVTIHEALKTVIDSQTHYRLREAQDRARAEDLNSRVSYWSVGETVALFVVSFSQVLLLKSFFTEKRAGPRAPHS